MKFPIYMDHHATTPVDERVFERMKPFFMESYGNASSRNHVFGWKAEEAVDVARARVGKLLGTTAREIYFTSGATEANNLALFGVAEAYAERGKHIITQATEHKAVLDPCERLRKLGWEISVLPVDSEGRLDPDDVGTAIRPDTVLVSVMTINNEVGTIQPIGAIGALCKDRGVLLHTDATQAAGIQAFDVEALGVDLVSLSAHKMYGPKGVGALYVRRKGPRVTVRAMLHGGGHERGMRSGTLNVPGIVGFGEASHIALNEGTAASTRIRALRDRLQEQLTSKLEVHVHGPAPAERHPGNLNIAFAGVEGEALILSMRDVALSSGAACASATLEPSHVLRAMRVGDEQAHNSLRFGLGRGNTQEDVDRVASLVIDRCAALRERDAVGRRRT